MDFKDLKNKRKRELETAIEKQAQLVSMLEKDFHDLDKFEKGKIIVNNSDRYYYLIVGEPVLTNDSIRIPIRHDVYATYGCGRNFKLNMSGVIDCVEISIDKIPEVEVITPREVFERAKDTLIKEFKNYRLHYESEIESCKKKIVEMKERIKLFEKKLEDYETVDIDSEFNDFVNRYLDSGSFESVAFEGCKNWQDHNFYVWKK